MKVPSNITIPPIIYNKSELLPNSCFIKSCPKLDSEAALVTTRPVAVEINKAGI